jgi:hypothetical protein
MALGNQRQRIYGIRATSAVPRQREGTMVTLEYARACIDEVQRQAQVRRRPHQSSGLARLLHRLSR